MNTEIWLEVVKIAGPVGAVLIIMGRIIYMQQVANNRFVEQMQKQMEVHNSKVIEFVSNISATARSDTEAVRGLSETVAALNRDCRMRFEKGSETDG